MFCPLGWKQAFSGGYRRRKPYFKGVKDTGIQLEDIHDIFITHEHIDHLLGVIWLIRMIGQKKIGQGKYEGICGSTAMKSWQDQSA